MDVLYHDCSKMYQKLLKNDSSTDQKVGLQLKKIGQIPASLGGSVASQKEKP